MVLARFSVIIYCYRILRTLLVLLVLLVLVTTHTFVYSISQKNAFHSYCSLQGINFDGGWGVFKKITRLGVDHPLWETLQRHHSQSIFLKVVFKVSLLFIVFLSTLLLVTIYMLTFSKIQPFQPNVPFLHPLTTWRFQRVQK